jgi:predicted RNase H-like HicB family nuclease
VEVEFQHEGTEGIRTYTEFGTAPQRRRGTEELRITNYELRILEDMKKYLVIIEETATGFSAYSPDLDGCVATGATREEVEKNMREAIEFHVEGLQLEGYAIPEPHTYSSYVEVSV